MKLIFLILLFINYCSAEQVSSNRVYVDEVMADSMTAKDYAVKTGLVTALKQFIGRTPLDSEIQKLQYSFYVVKEKFTDTRYQAILVFSFDTDEISDTFHKTVDKQSQPMIVATDTTQKESNQLVIVSVNVSPKEWIIAGKDKIEELTNSDFEICSIQNDAILISISSLLFEKLSKTNQLRKHNDTFEVVI